MNWILGNDKYYVHTDEYAICCINLPPNRRYELWHKKSKQLIASALASGEDAERQAIQHLKDLAEAS